MALAKVSAAFGALLLGQIGRLLAGLAHLRLRIGLVVAGLLFPGLLFPGLFIGLLGLIRLIRLIGFGLLPILLIGGLVFFRGLVGLGLVLQGLFDLLLRPGSGH